MKNTPRSILLLGESDVGKTHYGAQILRRLNAGPGAFGTCRRGKLETIQDRPR